MRDGDPRDVSSPLLGISQRQPPCNLQAEQSLLGALLANNRALDRVISFLEPHHFADPINGRIYKEIRARVAAGGVADPISLKAQFENTGILNEVGGTAYLAQLLGAMVGIIAAAEYGLAIRDAADRRELIAIGEEMVNAAFGPPEGQTARDLCLAAITQVDALLATARTTRGAITLDAAMTEAIDAMERATKGEPLGVRTGLRTVDEHLGGLPAGEFNLIAARPSMGKTSFALGLAVNAAIDGYPVLFAAAEGTARALARRVLAAAARIPSAAIKRGTLNMLDAQALVTTKRDLGGLPLEIDDSVNRVSEIAARAREFRRRHKRGIGLLVVDNLHALRGEDADLKHGPTEVITQMSGSLRRLGKQLDCAVVLLSQLSRALESRDDKRPQLSDLRQSGSLEQDADVIGFLYRAEYYMRNEPEQEPKESNERFHDRLSKFRDLKMKVAGKAELILAKVREDATATIPLNWHAQTTSFSDTGEAPI